jgi:hypothetical protein
MRSTITRHDINPDRKLLARHIEKARPMAEPT